MDEKLREILSIERLMEEVMTYRYDGHLLRKITKQTCNAEAKKLQNVEISIAEKELKLPKPEQWPTCTEIKEPNFDVQAILEDYEQTSQALEFLR